MYMKMSSAKWWSFCPGGDELREQSETALIVPGSVCSLVHFTSFQRRTEEKEMKKLVRNFYCYVYFYQDQVENFAGRSGKL